MVDGDKNNNNGSNISNSNIKIMLYYTLVLLVLPWHLRNFWEMWLVSLWIYDVKLSKNFAIDAICYS